jgi:4-diphosphocytidyl-2-C-methyl-D-erythritol kinase
MAGARFAMDYGSCPDQPVNVTVLAPAKVNLGLEVVRRRDDGFHELRTIYCAVSVFDRIAIETNAGGAQVPSAPYGESDLAQRAARQVETAVPDIAPLNVSVEKRIPVAAGLGGGSSDAGAVLVASARLTNVKPTAKQMQSIAESLGSDVPFATVGGLAIGRGRGEKIEPLPFQPVHFVLVVSHESLSNKTRTMFEALQKHDMSDGSAVEALARGIAAGSRWSPFGALPNSFERAMFTALAHLEPLKAALQAAAGRPVAMSGAGPTLFLTTTSALGALELRDRLRPVARRFDTVDLLVARSVPRIPMGDVIDG